MIAPWGPLNIPAAHYHLDNPPIRGFHCFHEPIRGLQITSHHSLVLGWYKTWQLWIHLRSVSGRVMNMVSRAQILIHFPDEQISYFCREMQTRTWSPDDWVVASILRVLSGVVSPSPCPGACAPRPAPCCGWRWGRWPRAGRASRHTPRTRACARPRGRRGAAGTGATCPPTGEASRRYFWDKINNNGS